MDSLPSDSPEDYPWARPGLEVAVMRRDGLQARDGLHEIAPREGLAAVDSALTAEGAAPLDERTLVVAVGSNQSPAVIARKYRRAGHDGPAATAFLRCTVTDLAVGHSAHVSARGYIAAAPRHAPGAVTDLLATWFDDAQLEIIDRSEPNYERLELTDADYPVELVTGTRPSRFSVYASRWGVIADGPPLALQPGQQDLFSLLGVLTGAEAFSGEAAEVCARLAEEPATIGELLRKHALVVPDGLPRTLTPR